MTTEGRPGGVVAHRRCLLCGTANPMGLGLRFRPAPAGGVEAFFRGHAHLQGYPDRYHGGVLAALVDAAMTHSLFDRGIEAVTGELRIRYHRPVATGETLHISAQAESSYPPLHKVVAHIAVDGELRISGWGKFMEHQAVAACQEEER